MGKSAKKNLALAGCGAQAGKHLKVLKGINSINLVALCDIDEATVARRSKEFGISHYYTNFTEMLKNEEDLSIVSILTPPQAHASMAIEAIGHGINVLVEKPLTMTTSEAESILKALKGTHVKLTLNYNALLNNAMMKTVALTKGSSIGQVLGVEVKMLHTKNDVMASDKNHWSHRLPGGRFGEMLAHPVYLLQALLSDSINVEKILTDKRGNLEWMRHDELYVLLHGNSGTGHIYVSFNAPRPAFLVDVYCTEAILKIDIMNQTLLKLGTRGFNKTDAAIDCLSVSSELFQQTLRNTSSYLLREKGQVPLENAYTSLVDAIDEKKQLLVTPEMAYNTVRIVEEICKLI